MNWTNLWMKLFGTTTWRGLDMGFWVSMGISVLVALLMVIGFWAQKPCQKPETDQKEQPGQVHPMTHIHKK